MRLSRWITGALAAVLVVAAIPAVTTAAAAPTDDGFVDLFNGENLDGWYTYTPAQGKNNDTEGVFKAGGGELKILDVPVTGEDREFGYLSTTQEYSNYHLRLQYKWGEKKFAPRDTAVRDSGLLYHVTGEDTVWPTSMESQVQEGDTGDYITLGPTMDIETAPGTNTYQAGGELQQNVGGLFVASSVADTLEGWNTVEVIVEGNTSTHVVNGTVVNRSTNQTLNGQPLDRGRIAIQAEGAEVTYRDIEIKQLPDEPAAAPRVLAFSKTQGAVHDSIPAALDAIDALGAENGFEVDRSADAVDFTTANLATYDAVVFVSTTGDVLDAAQQAAFEQYIRDGGGYAGVHAAADTEYDWPWYSDLVGAYFDRHPALQQATIKVEDRTHPSTAHLADTWTRVDEWYDFRTNPRENVNVLMTVDESSYDGGGMGADHPIAWYHEFDGGRAWYTGLGHSQESFADSDVRKHLLGGIQYAIAGSDPVDGEPLSRSGWSTTASTAGDQAALAIDGKIETRWSTQTAQAPGAYFQVDLGAAQEFGRIRLSLDELQPFDYPRGYAVYASNDPAALGEPIATGQGAATTDIAVPATTARYIRVEQTGADPFRYWSIYEPDVFTS